MENKSVTIDFDGSRVKCNPSKSILDNLLDNNIKATFSCTKGSCLTCMLRTDDIVPKKSQEALKPTFIEQGYFLACQAMPIEGMKVQSIDQSELFVKATIKQIKQLAGHVAQIFLTPHDRFDFRPGQFLNIKKPDGQVRSYSIASTAEQEELEIHVKKHKFGRVSGWLGDELKTGDDIDISGPNGSCFYIKGQLDQPLLLIGTGTGLAPLLGIIRQALSQNHSGKITLYHGAVEEDGLYLSEQLQALAKQHPNLEIHLGTLNPSNDKNIICGSINEIALANHRDLKGWQVYLCGDPQMVQTSKQKAFLAGANLSDILSDPFEMKDPSELE
jgi:NAD(P)H-flavin reductase